MSVWPIPVDIINDSVNDNVRPIPLDKMFSPFPLMKCSPHSSHLQLHFYRISCVIIYFSVHLYRALYGNFIFFFFYQRFLSWIFIIHRIAREREAISLIPLYHFHSLHRHFDISQAITAKSPPLYIAGSRTRIGNFWFPRASR